jgi:hypothetical protein
VEVACEETTVMPVGVQMNFRSYGAGPEVGDLRARPVGPAEARVVEGAGLWVQVEEPYRADHDRHI